MENIQDIGAYLKAKREERKISIAEIAQEFKTKLEVIQAIESNDFDKFPAATYVKGYLRSYARHLDLDPDEIIGIYNKNYAKEPEQVLILKGKEIPRMGFEIAKLKPIIIISSVIISLLILTLCAFWLSTKLRRKDIDKKHTKESQEKTVAKPTPPPPLTTPISTPITLSIQALDTVWMRVHADNKLIFEGILSKNEEKKWQANTEFKIRIGNPSKLNLFVNGKPTGPVAPYGPVNAVINENGIKVEK